MIPKFFFFPKYTGQIIACDKFYYFFPETRVVCHCDHLTGEEEAGCFVFIGL